jgi:hypothetical protein
MRLAMVASTVALPLWSPWPVAPPFYGARLLSWTAHVQRPPPPPPTCIALSLPQQLAHWLWPWAPPTFIDQVDDDNQSPTMAGVARVYFQNFPMYFRHYGLNLLVWKNN